MSTSAREEVPAAARAATRVHCHALRGAVRCDQFIGYHCDTLRFIGVAKRAPDHPDGRIWIRCTRRECSAWNIFEVTDGVDSARS